MYDRLTIERIKTMHPILREELTEQYLEVNKRLPKGVRLRLTHTLRTIEEQDALYAIGRTVKGTKVTNAKGGESYHNYGLAFDIVILLDKDNNGTFESISYAQDKHFLLVANYFKSKGWEWGGDWARFKDYPHFQKTFGLNINSLKSRRTQLIGKYKYPVL